MLDTPRSSSSSSCAGKVGKAACVQPRRTRPAQNSTRWRQSQGVGQCDPCHLPQSPCDKSHRATTDCQAYFHPVHSTAWGSQQSLTCPCTKQKHGVVSAVTNALLILHPPCPPRTPHESNTPTLSPFQHVSQTPTNITLYTPPHPLKHSPAHTPGCCSRSCPSTLLVGTSAYAPKPPQS